MSKKTGLRTKLVCPTFTVLRNPVHAILFAFALASPPLLLWNTCVSALLSPLSCFALPTLPRRPSHLFFLFYTLGQNLFQSCGLQLVGPPIQSRCAEGTFGETGCSSGIRQAIPYRLFELKGKSISTASEEESISALWYGKWGSTYCKRTAKDSLGLRAKRQRFSIQLSCLLLVFSEYTLVLKRSDIDQPLWSKYYKFFPRIELGMTVDSEQASRPAVVV